MKARIAILSAWLFLVAGTAPAADLAARLERLLAEDRYARMQIGMQVVDLENGRTVFARNQDQLLQPASNAKLFTAALVVDRLDPESRIQTSAYGTAPLDVSGRLPGDLIVYGRGDPSFSPRFHRGDGGTPFRAFARAIYDRGLRVVVGDLIADESHFNTTPFGRGWTWDELDESYAAEVSALSAWDNVAVLNVNPGEVGKPAKLTTRPRQTPLSFINQTLTARTGTPTRLQYHRPFGENRLFLAGAMAKDARGETRELTVRRPAAWFGQLLRTELESLGVEIEGKLRVLNWEDRLREPRDNARLEHLASVSSPPFARLNEEMMKESQNLYAQLLLLQVGGRHARDGRTTDEAGLLELAAFLGAAGIDPDDVRLEEGSGLSRRARVTPAAIVGLLRHMARHPRFDRFRATLPLAGVDGTLAGRFQNTPAQRNLRAKTGSLNEVKALSGYVHDAAGREHAFAIIMNNHSQGGTAARAALDALAVELAR